MPHRGSGRCSKSLLSNRVPAGFKDSAAAARLPPAPSFPIPHYLFHYSTISPTSSAIWLPEKWPNHCLDFAFTSCLIFWGRKSQMHAAAEKHVNLLWILRSTVWLIRLLWFCFSFYINDLSVKEKQGILSASASGVCEGFQQNRTLLTFLTLAHLRWHNSSSTEE